MKQKRYFVKIYDINGNFIGTSNSFSFDNFKKTINGGIGPMTFELNRSFDDFNDGDDIEFMNEIQVWIVDDESGEAGQKIYSGYTDIKHPTVDENKEQVTINTLGYTARMSDILYKNGSTVEISESSTDPSTMIENILDRLAAEETINNKITYTASSIDDTGNSGSYTFILKTCTEAIEVARGMGPANWYWYVNADNTFYFKEKPTSATHTFTFGKNLMLLNVEKNLDELYNQVILWNNKTGVDALLRSYSDTDSQNEYGLRIYKKSDSGWDNADSMDLYGNTFLATHKDPSIKTTVKIIDSNFNSHGYDIESIEPGDTCQILNLPTTSTVLGDNMTISTVTYYLDHVELQIEETRQSLIKRYTDLVRDVHGYIYNENDTSSYTTT
jgi:hypothetical protein